MKKTHLILLVILSFLSCKNDKTSDKTVDKGEELTLLKGEFVYYDGAAVLQTQSDIYGVFITDKMLELNKQAEKYKAAQTDMVNVEIKGRISNKKDDKILWENKVEVIEILSVTELKKEDKNIIKLGSE